jgi:transposase
MARSQRKSSSHDEQRQQEKRAKQLKQEKSRRRAYFKQRYARLEDLPVVHRHPAGIDLGGKNSHFVALEIGDEIEVCEFGLMTKELSDLVRYLHTHEVTTVAMESTGVYWVPLYNMLEQAGIEVYLANPSHVKNVPGRRKDDKLDCRWLLKLHKYGLLSASFRPDLHLRPLREYYRQREKLVDLSADALRQMQRALDLMNLRVHYVLSDLGGVTGMRIIRAVVDGQRDPAALAVFRDPRCECSEEELRDALTGFYSPEAVTGLRLALQRYDMYLQQIVDLDRIIEAALLALLPGNVEANRLQVAEETAALPKRRQKPKGKHAPAFAVAVYIKLLTGQDPTILPGIEHPLALGLLAELGTDLSKWPSDRHFGSYLTLAPFPKISGGKVLSTGTRKGEPPAAALFRQAAIAVSRTQTAIGAFYRRLASRIGKAKAVTATAYKIARMYYQLMRYGRQYVEVGVQQYELRYHDQKVTALKKQAKRLGYALTPVAA